MANRLFQESSRQRERKNDEMTYSLISCSAAYNNCDCPDRMYCRTRNDSCNRSAQGFCERIKAACTQEYNPVYGCDGVTTYANPFAAWWSQASNDLQVGINYQGKCKEKVF